MASSHYLPSAASVRTVGRGGSAVDACITISAVLSLACNHMAGLGGDLFAQVWDPGSAQVMALSGSSRSGEKAAADAYRATGGRRYDLEACWPLTLFRVLRMPWARRHERYGKPDWPGLFPPAIAYSTDGASASPKYRGYVARPAGTLLPSASSAPRWTW
ncbi:MAG: hypothetical protein HPY83_02180 [Anaerolineae bacterium]|nr:hypothetical protein [Anaerolineae bacterium]